MRRVRYSVAMSLDGHIADAQGEADWIIMDPEIDFTGLFEQFTRSSWDAGRLKRWGARARSARSASRLLLADTAAAGLPRGDDRRQWESRYRPTRPPGLSYRFWMRSARYANRHGQSESTIMPRSLVSMIVSVAPD